jgi:hypothetical protein
LRFLNNFMIHHISLDYYHKVGTVWHEGYRAGFPSMTSLRSISPTADFVGGMLHGSHALRVGESLPQVWSPAGQLPPTSDRVSLPEDKYQPHFAFAPNPIPDPDIDLKR